MRSFEILIVLGLFLALGGFFLRPRRRPRFFTFVPFLSGVLVLIHLVVEKYRWQMVPAYILVAIMILVSLAGIRRRAGEGGAASRGRRIAALAFTVLGVILALLAAAIPWLFPVVNLPRPTGPFAVGTASLHLIDPTRTETIAGAPLEKRELMARVWYPAQPAPGAKPIPYWEKAKIIGRIRVEDDLRKWGFTWLPLYFFDHFALMKTNSYPDAPLAGARPTYPVLIFSPGGGVIHEHNFLQAEELASHGYVVMSLSHPYESWAVIFPHGRVVRATELKAKTAQTQEDKDREKKSLELVEKLKKTSDIGERKAIMREFFELDPDRTIDKLLRIRVRDVAFSLAELQRKNAGGSGSPFQGRLDLEHIGIFGMSLGGAVAGQACLEDVRLKAGVNLDGTQFGDVIDGRVLQPFLFMNSGESKDHNDFVYDRFENDTYSVTIKGSSHMDFTDMFFTIPLYKRLSKNTIPDRRMYRVANAYILAFFDKYLNDKDSPLLNGPSKDYPEVTFKIIKKTG